MLGSDEANIDPIVDDPVTDPISIANLPDIKRVIGRRRRRDLVFVAQILDHTLCKRLAGRARATFGVQQLDDLVIMKSDRQFSNAGNEWVRIADRVGTIWTLRNFQASPSRHLAIGCAI